MTAPSHDGEEHIIKPMTTSSVKDAVTEQAHGFPPIGPLAELDGAQTTTYRPSIASSLSRLNEQEKTNKVALEKHSLGEPVARPDATHYVYEPLLLDNSQIRVLDILPGELDDEIRIQLRTVDFALNHSYQALSYAWGDATNERYIISIINGQQSWTLSVTKNCAEALRYLRHTETSRVMWIDAICINQCDLDERARQVSIMRSIFSNASQVVVWLGPALDNSDLAMDWIDTVGQEVACDLGTLKLFPLTENTTRIQCREVLGDKTELEAVTALLERGYFNRLWVWQEVRMGGDSVELRCGRSGTRFQRLLNTIGYLDLKHINTNLPIWNRLAPRLRHIAHMPLVGLYSALEVLHLTKDCECMNDRDRIYTCMSFGDLRAGLQLMPDYNREPQKVFTDFILRYLDQAKNLDFLRFIGNHITSQEPLRMTGLPSWSPNWSRHAASILLKDSLAGALSRASVISADHERLVLKGIVIGSVDQVIKFEGRFQLSDEQDIDQIMHRALSAILRENCCSDMIDQLVAVLTNNFYSGKYVPRVEGLPTFEHCKQYLLQVVEGKGIDPAIETLPAHPCWRYKPCLGRALFKTTHGRLGLGPGDTKEGDIVAVLLGSGTATILRPTNGGVYSVVGSANCTGLMDGEALLGALPEGFETVRVHDEVSKRYYWTIRNRKTGEIVYEDPRLPQLPSQWIDVREKYSETVPVYHNQHTEELRNYFEDPRMDAEALESRGVKLQEFCLV